MLECAARLDLQDHPDLGSCVAIEVFADSLHFACAADERQPDNVSALCGEPQGIVAVGSEKVDVEHRVGQVDPLARTQLRALRSRRCDAKLDRVRTRRLDHSAELAVIQPHVMPRAGDGKRLVQRAADLGRSTFDRRRSCVSGAGEDQGVPDRESQVVALGVTGRLGGERSGAKLWAWQIDDDACAPVRQLLSQAQVVAHRAPLGCGVVGAVDPHAVHSAGEHLAYQVRVAGRVSRHRDHDSRRPPAPKGPE